MLQAHTYTPIVCAYTYIPNAPSSHVHTNSMCLHLHTKYFKLALTTKQSPVNTCMHRVLQADNCIQILQAHMYTAELASSLCSHLHTNRVAVHNQDKNFAHHKYIYKKAHTCIQVL